MALSRSLLRRVALPTTGALIVGVGIALVSPAGPAAAAEPQIFTYGSGITTYTVPAGVQAVNLAVYGAQGGGAKGGKGGKATTTLTVTAGQVLNINVGGRGDEIAGGGFPLPDSVGGAPGDGNVDGTNHVGGGAASDVRLAGNALSDRVIVAGGGGGGGNVSGGAGGNPSGDDGSNGLLSAGYGGVGGGGSQSAGGAAGTGTGTGSAGGAGTSGMGGDGGAMTSTDRAGAGGGGGYFGGGGGGGGNNTITLGHPIKGLGGAGGGGSSWVTSTGTSGTSYTTGNREGNGLVILTPISPPSISPAYAEDVTSSTVKLVGQATTQGAAITATGFKYAQGVVDRTTLMNSGTDAPGSPSTLAGGTLDFSANLTGLTYGQTYSFIAYAVSSISGSPATSYSSTVYDFDTSGEPTMVTGSPIAYLTTASSAAVNGTVNPNGQSTTVEVQYSTSSATVSSGGGTVVPLSGAHYTGSTARSFIIGIDGLSANTTYYYRVAGTSSVGTGVGSVASFTTKTGSANTSVTMPSNPVGSRSATFTVRSSTFAGAPLSGPATIVVTSPLNQVSNLCVANLVNGVGKCSGKMQVGTNLINAKFNNGSYSGDAGAAALEVRALSTNVGKVKGKGSKRKADLSGLTSGKNQTITIYRVKNGKSAKIGTAKSNSKGNWSKKNVAIKTGGTVYVYTYYKKKKSNKAKV